MDRIDWVKLFRSILKWEWYGDPYMVALWVHLLVSANFKDNRWRGIVIKRGQLVTGRKALSNATGISEQTIRTCLEKLKSTNEITIKSTNKYSIITISNFDSYQQDEPLLEEQTNQQDNQPLTINQPSTNQQLTTLKEGKNEKNDIYNSLSQDARAHARTREDELAAQMISEQQWFEQLCMSRRISQQEMAMYIMDFCNYLRDVGKVETLYEAKIHFVNQLPKQIKMLKENGQQNTYNDPVARRNYERYQRVQAIAARIASLGAEDPDPEKPIL